MTSAIPQSIIDSVEKVLTFTEHVSGESFISLFTHSMSGESFNSKYKPLHFVCVCTHARTDIAYV